MNVAFAVLVLQVALQVVGAAPADPTERPCSTPRQAAITFLTSLRDDRLDVRRAAKCAEAVPGMSRAQRERAVQTLKAALDARGIVVRIDQLPDEPDYVDPKTYDSTVSLTPLLPAIYLERTESGWMFPASVLTAADTLYESSVAIDLEHLVREMPPWALERVLGLHTWQWMALVILALLGIGARLVVTSLLAHQVHRIVDRFGIPWGSEVIRGASLPLGNLALAAVFGLLLPSLALPAQLSASSLLAGRLLAAFSGVMLLYRGVDLFAAYMDARVARTTTRLDDQLVPLVRRGLKVVVVSVGVVFVLQNLNIDVRSLVAGLGIGGLAVALAAKDTLGNFFGSLTIFLDRPFQIGDYVNVAGVDGTVETVGFRSTRLRTPHDSIVTIPNAKLAEDKVDNFGARRFRRVKTTINITHAATPPQIEAFCAGTRGVLMAHPKVRRDEAQVHLFELTDAGLALLLVFYLEVDTYTDELRSRHEIFLDVRRLAHEIGILFASPLRTLVQEKPVSEAPQTEDLVRIVRAFSPGGARVVAPGPRLQLSGSNAENEPARSV